MNATTNPLAEAEERGQAAGYIAATWAFVGNTPKEAYAAVLQGLKDGDPEIMDAYSVSPLSGEWAGESIPELLGDLLDMVDESHRDSLEIHAEILNAYDDGFQTSYWEELERVARYQTSN